MSVIKIACFMLFFLNFEVASSLNMLCLEDVIIMLKSPGSIKAVVMMFLGSCPVVIKLS